MIFSGMYKLISINWLIDNLFFRNNLNTAYKHEYILDIEQYARYVSKQYQRRYIGVSCFLLLSVRSTGLADKEDVFFKQCRDGGKNHHRLSIWHVQRNLRMLYLLQMMILRKRLKTLRLKLMLRTL